MHAASTSPPAPARLFISYARADGQRAAERVRREMASRAGLGAWQDLTEMEGGWGWWDQIRTAIVGAQHLVLVMTPGALRSDVVRREWQLARQEGVCVIPVAGRPIDFATLPYWMRREHFVDPRRPEQLERLARTLSAPCVHHRAPLMLEDLPADHVPRRKPLKAIVSALVAKPGGAPRPATVALVGAGGFGKTTLADAVCHVERVQQAFSDGIVRVRLGPRPDLLGALEGLLGVLEGARAAAASVDVAAQRLVELLEQRALLIVVDDVWRAADLKPFLRGGPRCARLVTTRDRDSLPAGAEVIPVEPMSHDESAALLGFGLPSSPELSALGTRLGAWPLLIKLVGATLRDLVNVAGQPPAAAIAHVAAALQRAGPAAFDADSPQERDQAVAMTLGLSLEQLTPPWRRRFMALMIFPPGVDVPVATVGRLWRTSPDQTVLLARRLHALSLLAELDLGAATLRLHDGVRDALQKQAAGGLAGLQRGFLERYGVRRWPELDAGEPYLWRHLEHHLLGAGRANQLFALLTDYDWLRAKLARTDVAALLAGFREAPADSAASRVGEALALAAFHLVEEAGQLAPQLCGRLPEDGAAISALLAQIRARETAPWLRPLQATLDRAGGALVTTLAGDGSPVAAVDATPDGRRIVAASWNGLSVWDPAHGRLVLRKTQHGSDIDPCVAAVDDRLAVSAFGGRLAVWELERGALRFEARCAVRTPLAVGDDRVVSVSRSGRKLHVWRAGDGERLHSLRGHATRIDAIALAGGTLLSASADRLIAWDIASGAVLLDGGGGVRCVGLDAQATVAVASDSDGISLWDLRQRRLRHRIATPASSVRALAVSADGRYAVTIGSGPQLQVWKLDDGSLHGTLGEHRGAGSWRGQAALRITAGGMVVCTLGNWLHGWHIESGAALVALQGHYDGIESLALTRDGRHAITGSHEGNVKFWRLDGASNGEGRHAGYVHAIALGRDERTVASGAEDGTIHVWEAEADRRSVLAGHTGLVDHVAFASPKRLVSTSYDGTVRFWALGKAPRLRATGRHGDRVLCLALTADGRRAFSGGEDNVVRQWDVARGAEVARFEGHHDRINALAVSADGRLLASASEDGTLRLWDVAQRSALRTLRAGVAVRHIAVDAAGTFVVAGFDEASAWMSTEIGAWRVADGQVLLKSRRAHEYAIAQLALSADGRYAATSSEGGELKVWDLAEGREHALVQAHRQRVGELQITADGRLLVSASLDRWLRIWRLPDLQPVAAFAGEGKIVALATSGDGLTLAVGEATGLVHRLRLEHGDVLFDNSRTTRRGSTPVASRFPISRHASMSP